MKNPQVQGSATLRGRRGIVLFVAGALVLGLGATGFHAAQARGSASQPTTDLPPTFSPATPAAPSGSTRPVRPTTTVRPAPTAEPEPKP